MHPTLLTLSALSAKSPEENPDSSDPQTGPVRQTTQPPLLISWSNQLLVEPPLSTFDVPPRDLLNTPNSSPGMLSRKKEHEHPIGSLPVAQSAAASPFLPPLRRCLPPSAVTAARYVHPTAPPGREDSGGAGATSGVECTDSTHRIHWFPRSSS